MRDRQVKTETQADKTQTDASYYWFSYPTAPRSMRRPDQRSVLDLHRMRDGCMILSLSDALHDAGFHYAGEVLNFPADLHPKPKDRPSVPLLRKTDVLVMPTRPPLDDDPDDRRSMRWSGTSLESEVRSSMRKVFSKLDRGGAVLSPEAAKLLPSAQKEFSELYFQINGGASIVRAGRTAKSGDKVEALPLGTVAYLISIHNAVEAGARLLGAFAMGGVQTLLWGQILRQQPSLLREFIGCKTNRLLMGRFVSPEDSLRYPYFSYKPEELQYQLIADIAF